MEIVVCRLRRSRQHLFSACVRAVSRERIRGVRRATIAMEIHFEVREQNVSTGKLRRLARDEALRFLDPE
jgi:hypothetical protein